MRHIETNQGRIRMPADWPLSVGQAMAALDRNENCVLARPPDGKRFNAGRLPSFLNPPATAGRADGRIPDVLGAIDRLSARWGQWGWRLGLFDQESDAGAFVDDVRWLLAHRCIAPDRVAWLGIGGTPALVGHAVDPFTGLMTSAHGLDGFAPADHGAPSTGGTLDNVVALIRDTVAARATSSPLSDLPAPAVTIDLMRFVGVDGGIDAAGLADAARLATMIAEIELSSRLYRTETIARAMHVYRPIAVGPANLASYVLSQGVAYDSDAGRMLAQATMGLITAACAAISADLADLAGPCPGFAVAQRPLATTLSNQQQATRSALAAVADIARPSHLCASAAAMRHLSDAYWGTARDGAKRGLRHIRFTMVTDQRPAVPTPLDAQSFGIAPLAGFTIDRELANGRHVRVTTPALTTGLATLGYDVAVQAAAIRRICGHRTLRRAPGVSLAALQARGLGADAVEQLEWRLGEVTDIRHAFGDWVSDAHDGATDGGFDGSRNDDYGFGVLTALGFSPAEIDAANAYCVGTGDVTGTQGLASADARALSLPTGDRSAVAHAKMIDALNHVLSQPTAGPPVAVMTATDSVPSTPEKKISAPAQTLANVGHV